MKHISTDKLLLVKHLQAAVAAQLQRIRRSTWKGELPRATLKVIMLNLPGPPSGAACALQAEERCSDMTMVSVASVVMNHRYRLNRNHGSVHCHPRACKAA